jgi:uncharacterized protein (DUF1697 family)
MESRPANDVHVALLRGINLGGRNRLPMEQLRGLFEEAGCEDVRSYIQSGNVVFHAPPDLARRVPGRIKDAVAEQYGLDVPVILRSGDELASAAAENPFLKQGADERGLHVMFLSEEPEPEHVEALDPNRSPGDAFVVRGREIYLHCPIGVARSKLTNDYFDRRLGTTSTSRNLRTIGKLMEMLGNPSD